MLNGDVSVERCDAVRQLNIAGRRSRQEAAEW